MRFSTTAFPNSHPLSSEERIEDMREKASEQIMSSTATASALPFGAKPQEKKKNSTAEVVAASMVGTAIEFYDNYCYSIAAASYFGLIFFTDVAKSDPVLATLLA